MTNRTFSIKGIVLGDVHCGHPRTTMGFILGNLSRYIIPRIKDNKPDVCIIDGDFWDRLLEFQKPGLMEVINFIGRLIYTCASSETYLYVLEGTPSHDWGQSKIFDVIADITGNKKWVKYIPKLCIETIPDTDINILFVPDEWSATAENTWVQVKELLCSRGLDKVDLCVMHGAFTYQMPATQSTHLEANYTSITNGYIFIGHHHVHNPKGIIIPPGSFDRVSHGEEEPKGWVEFEYSNLGKSYKFYENKHAMVYKTIDLTGCTVDDAIKICDKHMDHVVNSHYRLTIDRDSQLHLAVAKLVDKYPQHRIKADVVGETIDEVKVSMDVDDTSDATISRDTISRMVHERLLKNGIPPDEILEVLTSYL